MVPLFASNSAALHPVRGMAAAPPFDAGWSDAADSAHTAVSEETGKKRSMLKSEHNTSALARFFTHVSGGDPSHRGMLNFSVMSIKVKRAVMLHFALEHSVFPLLNVNTSSGTHMWSGGAMWQNREGGGKRGWLSLFAPHGASEQQRLSPRCIISVNARHVVCCRECPLTGRMLLLDTCGVELPNGTARLREYLMRTQAVSPPGEHRAVAFDERTPQQPEDCGGCCVMSLQNYLLPDGVYASVEAGELLRKKYGTRVRDDFLRGGTLQDLESSFCTVFQVFS